jgi:pyruvate-formate lyase-activating enzyme
VSCKDNPAWCPVPWTSISATNFGIYRLCVQAQSHRESRGILTDEKGSELDARKVAIKDMRNAPLLREVRKSMLAGLRHPVCQRCNAEDDAGARSRRTVTKDQFVTERPLISLEKCLEKTRGDGSIIDADFPVIELELRMGNRCNLRCRSCGPASSSAWLREYKELFGPSYQDGHKRVFLNEGKSGESELLASLDYQWFENSALMQPDSAHFERLRKVSLTGGEPLLIKKHFDFLRTLVSRGLASQITLDYNSNLTYLPDEVFELWPQFEKVTLGVSLDGPSEINDYIRYPAKFSAVEENLRRLEALPDKVWVWLTTTVMNLNVLSLPELIRWVRDSGLKKPNRIEHSIAFHCLLNPGYLRVDIIPARMKARVNEAYGEALADPALPAYASTALKAIQKFMNEGAYDPALWRKSVEINAKLDRSRSQKPPSPLDAELQA